MCFLLFFIYTLLIRVITSIRSCVLSRGYKNAMFRSEHGRDCLRPLRLQPPIILNHTRVFFSLYKVIAMKTSLVLQATDVCFCGHRA